MNNLLERYLNFLNKGKTERECVKEAILLAEEKGYKDIATVSKLKSGDKVFVSNYGKAIAFYQIGEEDISLGMNILGAQR